MLTPQQNTVVTYLHDALPESTPQQRAQLLDGRDGPERRSLGLVVDRAREHPDAFSRGRTPGGSR